MPAQLFYFWDEIMPPRFERMLPPQDRFKVWVRGPESPPEWMKTVVRNYAAVFVLERVSGSKARPEGLWYLKHRRFNKVLVSSYLPWQALRNNFVRVLRPAPPWEWGPSPLMLRAIDEGWI